MTESQKAEQPPASLVDVILGPPHALRCLIPIVQTANPKPNESSFGLPPSLPWVEMFCETCEGKRNFSGVWIGLDDPVATLTGEGSHSRRHNPVALFECMNCGLDEYVIPFKTAQKGYPATHLALTKTGQFPRYTVPVPSRVQRLMAGDDWELYRKGRDAESMGLGIAAFTYYRRAVENIKAKLIDKLVKVAQDTHEPDLVDGLQKAKTEWRFSAAMEDVPVPRRVLVGTHNPLTLLHDAFSDGVHNMTDDECLEHAQAGRRVLEHLLESIAEALADKKEVHDAIGTLMARKKSKAKTGGQVQS